ncbi:hypothetical protein TMatcc_009140 [Talaromyces marneffei ATCC 18224]
MSDRTDLTRSTKAPVLDEAPNMNDNVPASAATTPPDMGASTKRPWLGAWTAYAISLEVTGSMTHGFLGQCPGAVSKLNRTSAGRLGLSDELAHSLFIDIVHDQGI